MNLILFYLTQSMYSHSTTNRDDVNVNLEVASNKEAIGIAILMLVLIISPIIIILVRNAVATIQLYAMTLALKAKELKKEKRKSDSLLFQMLPPSVAMQLKQQKQVCHFQYHNYHFNRSVYFI